MISCTGVIGQINEYALTGCVRKSTQWVATEIYSPVYVSNSTSFCSCTLTSACTCKVHFLVIYTPPEWNIIFRSISNSSAVTHKLTQSSHPVGLWHRLATSWKGDCLHFFRHIANNLQALRQSPATVSAGRLPPMVISFEVSLLHMTVIKVESIQLYTQWPSEI